MVARASAFKTPQGERTFIGAYETAMKRWPVAYETVDISSRFGSTHVTTAGPKDAPALVLLHGYWATSAMWSRNVADFSKEYRLYAIDVMGQPSRSLPEEPIRSAAEYVEWLTATLNALRLGSISLVGMSYGGWLALTYTLAAPERVQKLALLSPGGLLPMSGQFSLRGMLMVFFPARFTVNSFMGWLGFSNAPGEADSRPVLDLMYRGLKHFRLPQETVRVLPTVFSDAELRSLQVPVLVLFGEHERICDPVAALARARDLMPDFRGKLVPSSRHDMCVSQHRLVDALVLDFLSETRRPTLQPAGV
jgi:pimeloyl-ACP methyl ester carboxylesterase